MRTPLLKILTLAEQLAAGRDDQLRRGAALGALEAVLGALPYLFLGLLVSDVLQQRVTLERALLWTLGMAMTLAAQVFLGMRSMIAIMTASHALFAAARERVADHARALPMGWLTRARAGALNGVLTSELTMLAEIWSHFIAQLASGVALPVIVGLMLMWLDWRLGLVMLTTLPLAFALLALATRWLRRITARLLPTFDDANQAIVESIRGAQVLRVFGRTGLGFERLELALRRQRDALIRAEVRPAPLMGLYGATIDAGFALTLYGGAWLWTRGQLEATTLLLFILVSVKFFSPLFDLGVALLMLRFADQALERVEQVLSAPALPTPQQPASPSSCELELRQVGFTHEGAQRPTLRGLDATLRPGTLTAIVGPSGAGKSTLLGLLERQWDVTEGSITLGGVDLRQLSPQELHRRVAVVSQDVFLFSGSVEENLRVGRPEATHAQLVQAASAAQAHDFIQALPQGYQTPLGEGGARLSGGQRQRISIARALLKDSPILLLDEATASVDPATEAQLQRAIDALVRERTVVVIAHRLRTIQRAHQILVLQDGQLVERGDHASLLRAQGVYARMWHEQASATGWHTLTSPLTPGESP